MVGEWWASGGRVVRTQSTFVFVYVCMRMCLKEDIVVRAVVRAVACRRRLKKISPF